MIDLHLHTNVSDGRYEPRELVRRAQAKGLLAISVTDHDTMGGTLEAAAEASAVGLDFIPGIEVTAVWQHRDVHILGYGLPTCAPILERLLNEQRSRRISRARAIADRLASLGVPISIDALAESAQAGRGKTLARPEIAALLVSEGHVASVAEAFDRFLGEGCAAYVPHQGGTPHEVVGVIAQLRGVASLAHPGTLNNDALIPSLVDAGMTCLEVFHSAHDQATQAYYLKLAQKYSLLPTGGSDYHGEGTRRAEFFGIVGLPEEHYMRLRVHVAALRRPPRAVS